MFHGSIVALITPFTDDGGIDFPALERLVSFHVSAGTDGLVVAGTTGESATLEESEYARLVEETVRLADGQVPVIAGSGSASTRHSVERSLTAERLGASGVLVVTPYYNRPTQGGLVQHYTVIADAISIPLLLYNVPSRTSVDLKPQTAAALSRHPRIVGFKEAFADMDRIKFLVAACGPDFVILSGDDPSCLEAMRLGARGVVSVAANIVPSEMHELCEAALVGDWGRAEGIDGKLGHLYETLALETNPIPVKWAVFEMGLAGAGIRLPLTPLDADNRGTIRDCLDRLEISRMEH